MPWSTSVGTLLCFCIIWVTPSLTSVNTAVIYWLQMKACSTLVAFFWVLFTDCGLLSGAKKNNPGDMTWLSRSGDAKIALSGDCQWKETTKKWWFSLSALLWVCLVREARQYLLPILCQHLVYWHKLLPVGFRPESSRHCSSEAGWLDLQMEMNVNTAYNTES